MSTHGDDTKEGQHTATEPGRCPGAFMFKWECYYCSNMEDSRKTENNCI